MPLPQALFLGAKCASAALVAATALLAVHVPAFAAGRCGGPPTVVLDIGHTPKRSGAISASGKAEYGYNRALALELAPSLRVIGFEVHVLNEKGGEISLSNRAARLAAIGQGVILSLHHDSVQPVYLERGVVDGKPVRFSRYPKAKGYSLFVSGRQPAFAASKALAVSIGTQLRRAGFTPSTHHAEKIKGENRPVLDATAGVFRYDGLAVLKSARMPAVLFEAGVIVNPEEERNIQNLVWQERLVRAVTRGVAAYCGL